MGALELVIGTGDGLEPRRISTGTAMRRWEWYLVAVAVGDGRATLWQQPSGAGPTTRRTRR